MILARRFKVYFFTFYMRATRSCFKSHATPSVHLSLRPLIKRLSGYWVYEIFCVLQNNLNNNYSKKISLLLTKECQFVDRNIFFQFVEKEGKIFLHFLFQLCREFEWCLNRPETNVTTLSLILRSHLFSFKSFFIGFHVFYGLLIFTSFCYFSSQKRF